ncbi:MAG TPA: hypothetical protein VGN23_03195 [Verrucomicrobiae bacterium]|jgi:hypothetical protein
MAFRIHDSVVRGEIDNRVKGTVRGKIWVHGRKKPVALELIGNACPDLAGCLLKFRNPHKRIPDSGLDSLNPVQNGQIGDITASRKVREFDIPVAEAYAMCKRGEKPPEHMANCLYIEWFSQENGRVVIESTGYQLEISAPEWQMSPAENEERARQANDGMNWFMQKITEAIDKLKREQKDPEEKWDEHDYEKFLKESDARTDKYGELLDKYGDSEEAGEKIAKEMGWDRELTPEEAAEEERRIAEMNRACEEALNEPPPTPDPHREGIDWIRTPDGDTRHPLQYRCSESAFKFWNKCEKHGLEKNESADLQQFVFEFQTTGVKLAGALAGIAEGREVMDAAFTVAYLKRALDHLHKSQTGLEAVASKKLLPQQLITEARKELFEIREGILKLMDEFRNRE